MCGPTSRATLTGVPGPRPPSPTPRRSPAGPALRTLPLLAAAALLTACAGAAPVTGPAPGPPMGEATVAPAPAAGGSGAGAAVSAADRAAGVLGGPLPERGPGQTVVVPGRSAPPPGRGRTVGVRIEVERGVPVDGTAFAGFVTAVLADPRSWGGDGSVGFARTDGPAPLRIVLATPATADRLCLPLDTVGRLSCRNGDRVVVNLERWVTGIPDYAGDLTGYRAYLVNHEVGHWLGQGHESCPGRGRPAPVMQQQTLGLDGCARNSWPRRSG